MRDDPELAAIVDFVMRCIERTTVPDKLDPKRREDLYLVAPERFRLACEMWAVPAGRQMREAYDWAVMSAHAMTEAPMVAVTRKLAEHRRARAL